MGEECISFAVENKVQVRRKTAQVSPMGIL